ncbi:MFS transporter [Kitasatospora viridis]|uniref:Transmembrane secretion effector n=1 Tax=Kitasatospora viridis TaxID=281105 RepID=A0A561TTM7_9ACTN|nr:MFS transporter [Kitasatospora viridis]TWF90447.1 hypothetical protein FHX73_13494 [Kitasatospora viridis]
MRELLRDRRARWFLTGQAVSSFGDSALWLALGVWIKQLTGSNSAAGLAFFVLALGNLTAPLAGLPVDRVRRRPLLIAVNLAAALLRRLGEIRLVAVALGAAAAGFLLQTVPAVPAVLAGAALLGTGFPLFSTGLLTLFQRGTPPALLGRTSAALGLLLSAPQALSVAAGSALATVLDYRVLLLLVAGVLLLAAVPLRRTALDASSDDRQSSPAEPVGPVEPVEPVEAG